MSQYDDFLVDELYQQPHYLITDSKYENGPQNQQLIDVFKFISDTFKRDISSVSDIVSTIKHFIKKYNKLSKSNDELKKGYDLLQQELIDNKNQTSEIEAFSQDIQHNEEKTRKKLKKYKQELTNLKEKNRELELTLEESRTQIRELKLSKEELESVKAKLEHDLSRTRNNLTYLESPITDDKRGRSQYIEDVSSAYNELVESYKQMNDILMSQRDSLVEKCMLLGDCLDKSQKILGDSCMRLEEMKNAKLAADDRVQEISNILPDIAQKVEESIPYEYRAKLPQLSEDYVGYILGVFDRLINMMLNPIDYNRGKSLADEDTEKKRYITLLGYLEDCLKYIQNTNKSLSFDHEEAVQPLGVDSQVCTTLLNQCARMGQFIDSNLMELGIENLSKSVSLFEFDSFTKAECLLNEFLKFVTEEQISESPIRELFAVFTAVCEVNNMLLDYSEKLKKENVEYDRVAANSKVIRDLQRDNFDLANWKAVNQERISIVQQVLENLSDDKEASFDVMAIELGKRYEAVLKANNQLNEKIQALENELGNEKGERSKIEAELSSKITETKDKVKTEEDTLNDSKERYESQIEKLTKENELLKKESDEKVLMLERQLYEKSHKLSNATRRLSNLETKFGVDEDTLHNITEERDNLLQQLHQMQQLLCQKQSELDQSKDKERKLINSRRSLKDKLAESDENVRITLEDIRKRNEEVQHRYDGTIKQLQDELEYFRKEILSVQSDADLYHRQKCELEKQITTLRVQEKTLRLRYDSLIERQGLEKKATEARNTTYLASLKAQSEKKIEDVVSLLNKVKNSILNILSERFNENINSNIDIQELLIRLDRRLQLYAGDKRVLQDAIKLRGELRLLPTQSLHDMFVDAQQAKQSAELSLNRVLSEKDSLETEMAKMKKATEKYTAGYKQAGEWEVWGKSLYNQVSTGNNQPISLDELRLRLSEAILTASHNLTVVRHLDLLRTQKQIQNSDAFREAADVMKDELSIRSVIAVISFAQRLLTLRGVFPLSTPLSPRTIEY